ncbi:MAG: hypothetical protein Q3983_03020 [Capnocytophaga sp.]|nr:hypothetical protein [Capnocytophaga sp.]
MKRYFLHATLWLQILFFSIIVIFAIGKNYIDDFAFQFLHFYPFESMIKGIIDLFLTEKTLDMFFSNFFSFFKYYFSIYPLLLFVFYFLLISFFFGSIIGLIWYFIKKKEPQKTAFWVKNVLLFELIFFFSLIITYLLWLIPHNETYYVQNDQTSIWFCYVFLITFPIFMIGQFLRKRNIKILGNTCLILVGLIFVFAIGTSFYSYQRTELNNYSYHSDTELAPRVYYNDQTDESEEDYEDYEEGYDESTWDFGVFDEEDLEEILKDSTYRYDDKYSYYTLSGYLKPAPDFIDFEEFNEENETLFKLYRYVDRDPDMIGLFWDYFGETIIEFIKNNKKYFNKNELDILLKTYEIEERNTELFEDLLEELDKDESYDEQFYALAPIFEKHNIFEYTEDAKNPKIDNADIRWAYTFWARRYREENSQIVYYILLNIKENWEENN